MRTPQQALTDYLSLRRGLGFKLEKHEVCLREFVSFLKKRGRPASPPKARYSLQCYIETSSRLNGRFDSASCADSPAIIPQRGRRRH
jgi:hypothetical protein